MAEDRITKRIVLSVSPEMFGIIEGFAGIEGKGKATIVNELLETMKPTLEATLKALQAVKNKQTEKAAGILLESAGENILKLGKEMKSLSKKKKAKK